MDKSGKPLESPSRSAGQHVIGYELKPDHTFSSSFHIFEAFGQLPMGNYKIRLKLEMNSLSKPVNLPIVDLNIDATRNWESGQNTPKD